MSVLFVANRAPITAESARLQRGRREERERQIRLQQQQESGDDDRAGDDGPVTDAVPEPAADLAADEHAEPLGERDGRRETLAQAEGPLEEDDEVGGPGEPEERPQHARADRGDRGSIAKDERVERADLRFPVRTGRVRHPKEEHDGGGDRQHADHPDRDPPARRLRDDARDRHADHARHRVQADDRRDGPAPFAERERIRDRRIDVREEHGCADARADPRRDDEREGRGERRGDRRDPHDERTDDQERLPSDPIGVRAGEERDRDPRRAIRRDDQTGGARRDPELPGHLLEHRAHDEAVVHGGEREEAEDEEQRAPLGRAQSRLRPANA